MAGRDGQGEIVGVHPIYEQHRKRDEEVILRCNKRYSSYGLVYLENDEIARTMYERMIQTLWV
jgi:hypothetical protein